MWVLSKWCIEGRRFLHLLRSSKHVVRGSNFYKKYFTLFQINYNNQFDFSSFVPFCLINVYTILDGGESKGDG